MRFCTECKYGITAEEVRNRGRMGGGAGGCIHPSMSGYAKGVFVLNTTQRSDCELFQPRVLRIELDWQTRR